MKFLTDSEYEKLLKGSVKPQEVILLEEKISKLEIEVSNTIRDNENLKKDHDLIIRRKDLEIDVKVSEATKELNTELAKLRLDNGNYKKETEILTIPSTNLFKIYFISFTSKPRFLNAFVSSSVSFL